jgi:hypothetical protein
MTYLCPYCSENCKKVARFRSHIGRKQECREKHERRLQQLAATTHLTPIRRKRARPRSPLRDAPPSDRSNRGDAEDIAANQQTPPPEDNTLDPIGMDLDIGPEDNGHYKEVS